MLAMTGHVTCRYDMPNSTPGGLAEGALELELSRLVLWCFGGLLVIRLEGIW